MKQIKVNPNNEKYYSSEFIKGFNCGAQRQFEADMADRKASGYQTPMVALSALIVERKKMNLSTALG